MFWQHCLESKKQTFLPCIPEQVYPAILETSKNKDVFQNRQACCRRIFEVSLAWFP